MRRKELRTRSWINFCITYLQAVVSSLKRQVIQNWTLFAIFSLMYVLYVVQDWCISTQPAKTYLVLQTAAQYVFRPGGHKNCIQGLFQEPVCLHLLAAYFILELVFQSINKSFSFFLINRELGGELAHIRRYVGALPCDGWYYVRN